MWLQARGLLVSLHVVTLKSQVAITPQFRLVGMIVLNQKPQNISVVLVVLVNCVTLGDKFMVPKCQRKKPTSMLLLALPTKGFLHNHMLRRQQFAV